MKRAEQSEKKEDSINWDGKDCYYGFWVNTYWFL